MWRDARKEWDRYIYGERLAGRVPWPPRCEWAEEIIRRESEARRKELEAENARKRGESCAL